MERKLDGADGIRGLACILVLIGHASAFFSEGLTIYVGHLGKGGVWLFFVLSAFLLTRMFKAVGFSATTLVKYGVGRCLRILPLFYIAGFVFYGFGASPLDSLLLRNGYAHLWTIPVEFKFYFVLPVFAFSFLWTEKKLGALGSTLLLVVLVLAAQYKFPYWDTPGNSLSVIWFLPCFLIGCYVASVYDQAAMALTDQARFILVVFVIAFFAMMSPQARYMLLDMPLDGWTRTKFVYMSVAWGILIVAVADGKGLFGRLLNSLPMRKVGAWSFSIYLFHWIVYGKLIPYLGGSKIGMIIAIFAAIAGGAAAFYLIEKHIEWFRHRLFNRPLRLRVTG